MRSIGWGRDLRGGWLVGLPVAVLGLLAVTALASREPLSAPGKSAARAAGGLRIDASPWEFALIAGGGLIAFICVLVYGGWSRRTPVEGSLPRLLVRLAVVLLPLVAVFLIAGGLTGLHRRGMSQRHQLSALASSHFASTRSSSFTVPEWVTWGIFGTLAAGVLLFVVGANRPRPQRALSSAMGAAVTAALDDLDTIADPRLAIIAAYRRMEQSLADAGFPRAAAEAPREYLGRVAGALEIDPKPLSTLTILFEAAKFSLRRLDATARQRAVSALHSLQAQLA